MATPTVELDADTKVEQDPPSLVSRYLDDAISIAPPL